MLLLHTEGGSNFMANHSQPPKDPLEQFYDSMRDVKPLKDKQERVRPQCNNKSKVKSVQDETKNSLIQPHYDLSLIPVRSATHLSYKQASISHKILRNLSKGQYNVDAILDLHGHTVAQAELALDRFLQECMRKQNRVVLIIHGQSRNRETPILKNKLNEWLRQINAVLAFCSAQPGHGSRGAVYVLLKRHTEEDTLG